MNRIFISSLLIASFGCLAFLNVNESNKMPSGNAVLAIQQPSVGDTTGVEHNYKNFCSGCHGEKMNAFVDRKWKHGNTRENLFTGIKAGWADDGMPSFDTAFTNKEMYALADYILEGIKNRKRYDFEKAPALENLFASTEVTVKLDTIVQGVKSPWSFAFLPDGEMVFTEKYGTLYKVTKDKVMETVSGVPTVVADGQGGLFDVVLHPDYKKNHLIYLSYSLAKKEGSKTLATTAIMRAKLVGNKLEDQKVIFEALPYSTTRHHYGGRMVFDRKGFLYFSVGERGNEKENPQSLSNDLGKIHRINDDGSVPSDNPFVNTPGAKPTIYAYGNRNPQGLTMNPTTGEIWSHEHGPRGGDEVNLVEKGKNYGWPVICYGINYNGAIITDKTAMEGMEQPLLYWLPSIAPSGMAFVEGDRYKGWKGDLMVGSLRFNYLNRCKIKGNTITGEELLLKNVGRMRDVRMGPDGYLYISVENKGYIFKLIPVQQ
ncbi:hypothetical protein BH11BAC3_BH11BAC3_11530 [soil metagenome]